MDTKERAALYTLIGKHYLSVGEAKGGGYDVRGLGFVCHLPVDDDVAAYHTLKTAIDAHLAKLEG